VENAEVKIEEVTPNEMTLRISGANEEDQPSVLRAEFVRDPALRRSFT
jgi:hypothetical protein